MEDSNKKQRRSGGRNRPPGRAKGRSVESAARDEVHGAIDDIPKQRDQLLECLHKLQDRFGFLASHHLVALAAELKMAPVEVFEVASFYHHFDCVSEGEPAPPKLTVRVCDSVSCEMAGAENLILELKGRVGSDVRIQPVPCVGRCAEAPVAVIGRLPIGAATLDDVDARVSSALADDHTPVEGANTDWPDYEAYCKDGGYQRIRDLHSGALAPEEVLSQMEASGLRGLGGAGFPAGRKWRILIEQPAPRLMAVNIDEGEPGTFKDRYFLERDPHRFLEGMLIAAHVVSIDACYLYVRDEYPGVMNILQQAVAELRQSFEHPLPEIYLRRGAGAYICGEESAMIESIEGKRGMPRLRPPYVAEVGLFGRPTLEHNCETLYWVREILEKGADGFAGHGRHGRTGLRSFSVSGRVVKPGVHIAPAGITLRELVDEYCGGMLPGHELKAYFPGGASGGILPASLAGVPLDFDTLQEYGCFIGSAAIIVLSDQDSVRRAALNAMRFFAHESCGQCTPCRIGTTKAAAMMESESWNAELLEELCTVMEDASICGLGQAAPNPLRCVIKYFPEEVGLQ